MANLFRKAIYRPQQIWLRKAFFQVHLWIGLIVALYVVLIGISGSILVFRTEIEALSELPPKTSVASPTTNIDVASIVDTMRASVPNGKLTFLYSPRQKFPAYLGYFNQRGKTLLVSVDPGTGAVIRVVQSEKSWLNWVGQLHYFLLLNRNPGLELNGIGAACLLLLTLTGIVLWWPGLKSWKRGLFVNFRVSWKRINYDAHNVVGFWTLAIVSFWAISGLYFTWPAQVTAAINFISPVNRPARITVAENTTGRVAPLSPIIAQAEAMRPGEQVRAIRFPFTRKAPLMLYMGDPKAETVDQTSYVYFDPATGKHLATIPYNRSKTAGDWAIWAMHPLHFGTSFGLGVKVLYFMLGLSLPFLVITGTLMYWNRYLGKKWAKLKRSSQAKVLSRQTERQTIST